jgi:hypothetical protein
VASIVAIATAMRFFMTIFQKFMEYYFNTFMYCRRDNFRPMVRK